MHDALIDGSMSNRLGRSLVSAHSLAIQIVAEADGYTRP